MKIFEETDGEAVAPSLKMFFVVLVCAACIGLLVAGALAMAINLRTARAGFANLRKKRMEKGALGDGDGAKDPGSDDDGEKRWGKERSFRMRKRKFRKSVDVVPYSESDISKMSPATMEEELRRLMAMQKEISVAKSDSSPRQAEVTIPPSEPKTWGKSPPMETGKETNEETRKDGVAQEKDQGENEYGEDKKEEQEAAAKGKEEGGDGENGENVEEEGDNGDHVVDLTKEGKTELSLTRQSVSV